MTLKGFGYKVPLVCAFGLLGLSTLTPASASSLVSKVALNKATVGFATQNGGTTGGEKASSSYIYLVSNISGLNKALTTSTSKPRIIQIKGTIDVSGGKSYTSKSDQKKRSQLKVPSNTTIIGVNSSAGLKNGSLVIYNVKNVIVRNLTIQSPVDVAPEYESGDGWNADWDGLDIKKSKNVWIDHMTFTDGSFTDDKYTTKNGETYVQHDGELDITHGSDYITISNSIFKNHDKTMLIGHSKNNSSEDSGHFRVTLVNNIFNSVEQRTPRVRFGKIHAYNNYFEGNKKASTYAYKYSFGLGYKGSILSEKNVFKISNLSKQCKVVKVFQSNSSMKDKSSKFNGSSLSLSGCSIPSSSLSWSVPYSYSTRSTSSLVSYLNKNSGAGKLSL